MINQCLIQYEQKNYERFIQNARTILFADFGFILENEVVHSKSKLSKFS
jgi:hypothetical protein